MYSGDEYYGDEITSPEGRPMIRTYYRVEIYPRRLRSGRMTWVRDTYVSDNPRSGGRLVSRAGSHDRSKLTK